MLEFELKKWLATLDSVELIDAETAVREARERKRNEGRVMMHRVSSDGVMRAYFMGDDIKGVITYLYDNADRIDGEIRTDFVRVPESEVAEKLASRWWD